MKAKTLLKGLAPLVVLGGAIALSALIFMVLWNAFLVPAVGVAVLSFWLAVKGWAFVYFVTAMVLGAKQFVDFLLFNLTIHVARRQAEKEMSAHTDLMKHFSMFGGQGEQNEQN